VNPDDLFAFINAWVNGNADFNGSGATDNADLIEFIACFTNLPAACTTPAPTPILQESGADVGEQTLQGTLIQE
jgi:hypothetical protein